MMGCGQTTIIIDLKDSLTHFDPALPNVVRQAHNLFRSFPFAVDSMPFTWMDGDRGAKFVLAYWATIGG
jgi:hypothetical protein